MPDLSKQEDTPSCALHRAIAELESSPQANEVSNWKQLALAFAEGEEQRRTDLLAEIRTAVAHIPEPWQVTPYGAWNRALNHVTALPILNPKKKETSPIQQN